MRRYSKSPEERFAEKVRPEGGCLIWIGATGGGGDSYGNFYLDGRPRWAHIVAYEWANGPVPEGLELDHLCRRSLCVNPAHLEAVTHAENIRRGLRGALHVSPPACRNGHPFTPENRTKNQQCRVCARAACSRWERAHPRKRDRDKDLQRIYDAARYARKRALERAPNLAP
jgi:hypothetical protein